MSLPVLVCRKVGRVLCAALVIVAVSSLIPSPAFAQQVDAGIIGQVRDESGAVLPGVTITAKSPALQVPEVVTVTDARGEYRITPLPIGLYSLDYSLSGFQGYQRRDLRLTVGFVAKIDVTMKVGSLEETITVSGVSPVVDVTATNATTQFTRETLDILPGSRTSMSSLVAIAPGARSTWDVGGSAVTEQPNFRAFGQGGEAWPTVEGIIVGSFNAPTTSVGNYGDYNAFEEARVSTLGNGPEMPGRGMQIITVIKSGGNELHGSADYKREPSALIPTNIGDLKERYPDLNGALPILKNYDVGGDAGGRVVRNKVWWYGALRRRLAIRREDSGTMPDGRPAENYQLLWNRTEKVSYQISQGNKLVFFDTYNHKWDVSSISALNDFSAKSNKPTKSWARKLEWQSVIGRSIVTSLQQGFWSYATENGQVNTGPYAKEFPITPVPSYTDTFTRFTGGESSTVGRYAFEARYHTTGRLSWYKPDLFYGNHQFMVGGDYIHTGYWEEYKDIREAGNYQLRFRNGAANQLRVWQMPSVPLAYTNYFASYLGDSWTIGRRLTLNLGARYERNAGDIPEGCSQPVNIRAGVPFDALPVTCYDAISWRTFNSLSPRIHAALDVTGDGKNVLKGGWGRFTRMLYVGEVNDADPKLRATVTYRWRDLNNNRDWDPGESDLSLSGPDFVSITGGATTFVNPDLIQPTYDEYSTSFERQLGTDFGVRVTGLYSRLNNPYRHTNLLRPASSYSIPVTNLDPGPDGILNTSDDTGKAITYWEYPTSLQAASFTRNTLINDREADVHYTSLELALSKRMSNRWTMYASYAATKRHVPDADTLDEQQSDGILGDDNPNAKINSSDFTTEKTAKLSGGYLWPWEVTTSLSYEYRNGSPWGRSVEFTGGRTIPNLTVRVEPIGTRRMPSRNLINLSVQKSVTLGGTRSLDLRANIYNLINANSIMNVTEQSGPEFLVPTPGSEYPAIMQPRVTELAVTFRF